MSEEQKRNIGLSKLGKPGFNKGKKFTLEHRQKISDAKKGKWKGRDNPHWRGGISKKIILLRTSREYKLWREAIFKRDNYQCVIGGKEHGNKLNADHIKSFAFYPELRFAIDNGRTLCESCHKKTNNYMHKAKLLNEI